MRLFRPILSLLLVFVTTFLVSCSNATQAKIPTVYTPEKIAQLQSFREPIALAKEQMETLKGFIQAGNWTNTRTFIHGPLGQLRQDMAIVSRKLLVKDQKTAQNLAKELFGHLERIDAAAKDRNSMAAQEQYLEAVKDLDAFLALIPSNS